MCTGSMLKRYLGNINCTLSFVGMNIQGASVICPGPTPVGSVDA